MKISRKEQEKNVREALEMLGRAHPDGSDTCLGHTGPVNTYVAIGWAKACLRIALGQRGNQE